MTFGWRVLHKNEAFYRQHDEFYAITLWIILARPMVTLIFNQVTLYNVVLML